MSTEYRRGIPSVAHVEAATRLGLEWSEERRGERRWRFEIRNGELFCDFSDVNVDWSESLESLRESITYQDAMCRPSYRPIRTDGTPVDWEVLDVEVRSPGQIVYTPPATTVTPTAPAAPTQPQGFRADLWARVCRHFSLVFRSHNQVSSLTEISNINDVGIHSPRWQWGWGTADREAPTRQNRADILTRWAVYQELKPLYDIVDGARGEVAMPEDVIVELARRSSWESYPRDPMILCRTDRLQIRERLTTWNENGESTCERQMRNFAAVLDAVAEQRVAARQGQAQQPNSVTLSVGPSSAFQYETPVVTPEPRSFADVRPDRHGWRWWRVEHAPGNAGIDNSRFEVSGTQWRWLAMGSEGITPSGTLIQSNDWTHLDIWSLRTVIPTDEQGNPVSWESIGQGQNAAVPPLNEEVRRIENAVAASVQEQMTRPINWRAVSLADTTRAFQQLQEFTSRAITQAVIGDEQRLAENPELWREAQWRAVSSTRTAEAIYQDLLARHRARMSGGYPLSGNSVGAVLMDDALRQQPTEPTPLPRFTADELDDVDHSATTTQDSAALKRGKLPAVEAISKYREVMAKRNGTVAEAVKASGIDCEVTQYVLERWAGGLSDKESWRLLSTLYPDMYQISIPPNTLLRDAVDTLAKNALNRPTLDTSEPADTAAQRQRAEAAERKARMTALQAQLAKERAARVMEPEQELSRFALLEVDETADPARSIEAWKAQRARNVVRPAAVPAPQPALVPHRKAFEVIDAQAEGLSGTAALAVLLGRVMNGGC